MSPLGTFLPCIGRAGSVSERMLRKRTSDHFRQVWTSRAALVIQVWRLLARAVGLDLVGPREQLGVNAVAHNQAVNTVLARASALVTSDPQHCQFADEVAEDDGAVAVASQPSLNAQRLGPHQLG